MQNPGQDFQFPPPQKQSEEQKAKAKDQNNPIDISSIGVFGVGLEVENLTLDPTNQVPGINYYNQGVPQGQQYFPNYEPQGIPLQQNQVPYAFPQNGIPYNNQQPIPGIPIIIQPNIPFGPQRGQNNQAGGLNGGLFILDGEYQVRHALIIRMRKNTKWFTGCNACFSILLVIDILNKISLYNSDSSIDKSNNQSDDDKTDHTPNGLIRASAVIGVIEYIFWFLCIVVAIHGLTSSKFHLLNYYIKGLFACVVIETLSNILLFAGFKQYSSVSKVSFVIVFILTLLIQYSFIKNARQILRDIQSYKDKFGGVPLAGEFFNGEQNQHNPNQQQQQQQQQQYQNYMMGNVNPPNNPLIMGNINGQPNMAQNGMAFNNNNNNGGYQGMNNNALISNLFVGGTYPNNNNNNAGNQAGQGQNRLLL